jgi:hypothetical protein
MKRLIFSFVISILMAFLTGCAKPCFYQAGKNIEQCKRDLLQCIRKANNSGYMSKNALLSSIGAGMQKEHKPAELTCLCMQERGYQYLDANKLPQNQKRIMLIAPFQKYRVVSGVGAASEDHKILAEQKPPENSPDPYMRRRIKYQVRKDASGELMKDASGNYLFVPVYDDEQQEIVSLGQTGGN